MIRAKFAVAAIAIGATVVVTLNAIKEGPTSAQAQTQTASPERTIWDHNGSVMYLVANGSSREFYYQKPRAGMSEVGAHPGSLLFRGEIDSGHIPERPIFLTRIVDQSRSKSKDRFSTTMNGLC